MGNGARGVWGAARRTVSVLTAVALTGVFQTPGIAQTTSTLDLVVGKGQVLGFDANVARASITDPKIASVIVISPREILINGKASGVTNLLVWDEAEKSQVFDVHVQANIEQLQQMLTALAPQDGIEVRAARDSVVLTGKVLRPTTITEAERIALAFTGKDKVVNLLHVTEPAQVMLKVRIVEVNRTALQELGVDIMSQTNLNGNRFFFASQPAKTGAAFQSDTPLANTSTTRFPFNVLFPENAEMFSLATIGKNRGLTEIVPQVNMLESKDLARTLAEPNLLAKSGEEATFLAGGELPIPIVTANAVQISFKEFGVRLKFKPQVIEDGTIRLNVEPEVSTIDTSIGVSIGGVTVPGFRTRRTQTTVELRDNETLVIGGLLSQETAKGADKIPMASDLPVIGDLFKSDSFRKGESELLVMVTPSLIRPSNFLPNKPLQADRDLAPFVTQAGRAPMPDAQGDKFRSTHGHKRDAIWEPDRETDPFLRRSDDASSWSGWSGPGTVGGVGGPVYSQSGVPGGPAGPAYSQSGVGGFPIDEGGYLHEYDPEYHATLEKYQLVSEDPQYSQIPGMLRQRLWGRSGVADPTSEPAFGGLWEQLGYRSPSW
jgi:pilus assembly protein CpaC